MMIDQLIAYEKNPDKAPRAILMKGAGGKAFCAGGDIVSIYKAHKAGRPLDELLHFFKTEYILDYNLSQMEKIDRISLWNGICMGGGVGLTWHSPIRIATEKSMYAMPETAIGFFTDVGGSYFLPRIKNSDISLGLFLGLTGFRVKGADLVKYGIATHYVQEEEIDHMQQILNERVTKDSTHCQIEDIVMDHACMDAKVGEIPNLDEIRQIFKPDSIQKIVERLEASSSAFSQAC
jgi:3-hydroxyisobutyryl-CoA hydrolase